MPKLVNPHAHPIRPPDGRGGTHRILPGQVVEADGAFADALVANGAVSASKEDCDRYERTQDLATRSGTMAGVGQRIEAKNQIAPLRQAVQTHSTVAPLQRVIGDSAAPHGPGSGTITTRGEAGMSGEPGDREAFLQGDVAPTEAAKVEAPGASLQDVLAGRATQSDIHNAQVDNAIAAEVAAKAFIAGEGDDRLSAPYDKANSVQLDREIAARGLEVEANAQGNVTKPAKIAALEADDAK